jgi:RNA polymerase sporulation-specific sigma factor
LVTDVALVARARAGEREAAEELLRRYERMLVRIAGDFYAPGSEREDIEQEAAIGFLRGLRTFRPEEARGDFRAFAAMCVRRWLIQVCLRRERTLGKQLLDRAERVIRSDDGEFFLAAEQIPDPRGDVPGWVLAREECRRFRATLPSMPLLERRSIVGSMLGLSYDEIGPRKQVDNALQRAKLRLRAAA